MLDLRSWIGSLLALGALTLLFVGCALVLWPFLSALLWAAVICFSTWPLYRQCERAVGGYRAAAAAIMTMVVVFALAAPLAFLVTALVDDREPGRSDYAGPGGRAFGATQLGQRSTHHRRRRRGLLGEPRSRCSSVHS